MSSDAADPLDLPPSLAAEAFAQYQETPDSRRKALDELRQGILKLPEADRLNDVSDANLIRFVRCRKYDVARALATTVKLKRFYMKHATLLQGLDGESWKLLDQFQSVRIRKGLDKQSGKTILMIRPARLMPHMTSEFKQQHPNSLLRMNIWLMDRLSRDPDVQVNGLAALMTCSDMGFFDMVSLANVMTMEDRKILFGHMSALGIRMKGIYVFEAPLVLKGIFALVRPFLSAKLSSRVNMLGNDYASVIPTIIGQDGFKQLPGVYGGEGGEDIAFDRDVHDKLGVQFTWNP